MLRCWHVFLMEIRFYDTDATLGMGNGHVVGMDWCDEAGVVWLLVSGTAGGMARACWWAVIVKIEMIFYVQFG